VRAIALAKVPLVGRSNWSVQIQVEGLEPRETEPIYTRMNWISPGYFQTVGVPMLDGRDIDARDHASARKVAIVNQTFARRYFADKSPLGRRFGVGERSAPLDLEIIGVVKDSKYRDPKEKPEPTAYFSYLQSPMLDSTLHVRAEGSPEALIADIRRVVQTLDANIPLYDVKTLDAQIDETMTNERLVAAVTTGFGALATVLAAVGLYGVLAFSVARRTREIGIRMALGADRICVLRMIFRETLVLAGIGVILGLGGAWALTRYAGSLLYEVKPMDPVVLSAGVGGILLVAVASGYLPALRASRTDPIHALKQE
jgi:predicted permease